MTVASLHRSAAVGHSCGLAAGFHEDMSAGSRTKRMALGVAVVRLPRGRRSARHSLDWQRWPLAAETVAASALAAVGEARLQLSSATLPVEGQQVQRVKEKDGNSS